ncbi:hypothetical protein INR77_14345 [Erythrobacter sp. SCSIO 43205]|uniref:hypothetical protein n=1 Tax=Erythrobacter sp. SCSIO 43205 TaxID=2779361 RepID=UPI001CAA11F2|nr:hypothetical protein [Erythrobacter sp. SCSIO 43205]UAB77933.1 hypothetical protein INR77_14345 [Erythrobacter sp. SCSIO 43205]
MKVELKTWTQLGVATALAGLTLAGCSGEAGEGGDAGESAAMQQAGEAGEGEGGEGGEGSRGEGGEGGVDVAAAGNDPVTYTSALAVAEAHVIAARDAYAAGKTQAGAEMFAHPVSEVLLELQPVFDAQGVEDMSPLFAGASEAALSGVDASEIAKQADIIIAALRDAEAKAPQSDKSAGTIAAGVVADQIERAVAMYAQASESTQYGPYLDGYGYYKTAASTFERSAEAIRSEDAKLATSIEKALALLATAYPSVTRPENLDANQGELSGASASVMLAAS